MTAICFSSPQLYTQPSDSQYVAMDFIIMTVPPLVMGLTGAAPHLTVKRPQQRIFSFLPIVSLFSFIGFQALVYWGMYKYLIMQAWYSAS